MLHLLREVVAASGPCLHAFLTAVAGFALFSLIPEVKHDRRLSNNLVHFAAFVSSGVGLILVTRAAFHVR